MKKNLILFLLINVLTFINISAQELDSSVVTINLKQGWNIASFPQFGEKEISYAFSEIWNNVNAIKNGDGFYLKSNPEFLNSLKTVSCGKGYFINVSSNCELNWKTYFRKFAIQTKQPSMIKGSSALLTGEILSDGGTTIIEKGFLIGIDTNLFVSGQKIISTSTGSSIVVQANSLNELTKYFIISYATNANGTIYGKELSFTTTEDLPVDIEGYLYTTVTIGSQIWFAENLNTSFYNDGTRIPTITTSGKWGTLSTGGKAYYMYDSLSYSQTYGALYNWFAVSTNKLCPTGWHVPTDNDWKILESTLGMTTVQIELTSTWRGTTEGGNLKESGTTTWAATNTAATNSTGFTALPSGLISSSGNSVLLSTNTYFWSSVSYDTGNAWSRGLKNNEGRIYRGTSNKIAGNPVRCLKD